jgi:hypothetical protein
MLQVQFAMLQVQFANGERELKSTLERDHGCVNMNESGM